MEIKTLSTFSEVVRNRKDFIEYIDRDTFGIKQSFIYWIDYDYKNEYIIVNSGFISDFNSVPRCLHWIVDKDEFCMAFVHDPLYTRKGKIFVINPNNLSPKFQKLIQAAGQDRSDIVELSDSIEFLYNRKFADILWREGAIEEAHKIEHRDAKFQANVGYIGIRIGGRKNFKKI